MRTTSVLITAALSFVGAATTFAQVYSVNTVGYVNLTLAKGFNMIGNPLDNKTGNTVGNLFGNPAPAALEGAVIYKFAGGAYMPSNGVTFGAWDDATQTLVPGEGAFFYLDGPTTTVTFVGEVKQGTLTTKLSKGFNMVSSQVPQAGKLVADLKYTPQEGDVVYQYNAGAGYKASNGYQFETWDNGEPTIAVGEAFFLFKDAGTTPVDWVRTFTVQ